MNVVCLCEPFDDSRFNPSCFNLSSLDIFWRLWDGFCAAVLVTTTGIVSPNTKIKVNPMPACLQRMFTVHAANDPTDYSGYGTQNSPVVLLRTKGQLWTNTENIIPLCSLGTRIIFTNSLRYASLSKGCWLSFHLASLKKQSKKNLLIWTFTASKLMINQWTWQNCRHRSSSPTQLPAPKIALCLIKQSFSDAVWLRQIRSLCRAGVTNAKQWGRLKQEIKCKCNLWLYNQLLINLTAAGVQAGRGQHVLLFFSFLREIAVLWSSFI